VYIQEIFYSPKGPNYSLTSLSILFYGKRGLLLLQ